MNEIRLHSPVLTATEVAVCLRLCEPDADPDAVNKAVRSVHKLVRDGKLRPIQPGREYAFVLSEVERYVVTETEAFTPSKNGARDC